MPSIATPDITAPDVLALCHSVVSEPQAIYVAHRPTLGAPVQECFRIVTQHIVKHGGCQVFGWAIMELRGIWLEAEFHAVWQSPDGVLLDITPRQFEFERMLFLPDPVRRYEGCQVESVFRPLTLHPAVLRHIQLAHDLFVETNRGELAIASSYLLTPVIKAIQAEMQQLLLQFPWRQGACL